jgi:hypothetical protein
VIGPYDLRMGQTGSITPAELRRQAEQLHMVDEPRVIVLAGAAYTTTVSHVWPHEPSSTNRSMPDRATVEAR